MLNFSNYESCFPAFQHQYRGCRLDAGERCRDWIINDEWSQYMLRTLESVRERAKRATVCERMHLPVKSRDSEKFLPVEAQSLRPTNCDPFRIIWNSKKLLPQVVFFLECRELVRSSRDFPIRISSPSSLPSPFPVVATIPLSLFFTTYC